MFWFLKDNSEQITQLKLERDELKDEVSRLKRELEECRNQSSSSEELKTNLNQMEALIKFENEHMKSGLLDIQGNLANSVEGAKGTLKSVSSLKAEFLTGSENLNKISNDINGLSQISEQSGKAVEGMSLRAEEISSILTLIRGIAEQTNLLALNAAIEAARAGETGRGFAVVADEVRGLADKTQTAITEINDVINALKDNVLSVSNMSNQLISNINTVFNDMSNFKTHLNQVDNQIHDHFSEIHLMTDSVFMSLAKTDHMLWKINTYLSINNREPAFDFVDHHNCRLGKWYYEGEGKEFFSNSNHYKALETPHAAVHNGTKQIFELIKEENSDCNKIMEAVQVMEDASKKVFESLSEIAQDAKRVAK